VEFDTDADVETLYISDPYWLFYLRCSPKMAELAKEPHYLPVQQTLPLYASSSAFQNPDAG
jgi:hypothetical protein